MQNKRVKVKDKTIKIYSVEEVKMPNGEFKNIKRYIHNPNYSLNAYIRSLASYEVFKAGIEKSSDSIECVINYREINERMFVEFRKKTYQITWIDFYEFNNIEVKFRAREVNPLEFDEEMYDD